MPSNKELIEDIHAIDPDADVAGLTNKALVEILRGLKEPNDAPGVYSVAEGRAITSRSGVKGPGATVSARDLTGGQQALDALIAGGFVK